MTDITLKCGAQISGRATKTTVAFFDTVFHAPLRAGEEILVFTKKAGPKGSLGLPSPTMDVLFRTNASRKAYYYSTGTTTQDDSGELRNRLDNFQSLRVIVLDDIGSKVKHEDLPKLLQDPTYILESSEGNYQYGFVLDEPIYDVDAAKVLVDAVYSSGFTDGGGKMPTKIVRLPLGIHGKHEIPDGGSDWPVKLTRLNTDPTFRVTPQELLDAIGADLDWAAVKAKTVALAKAKASAKAAASPAADRAAAPGETPTDPLMTWLLDQGLVLNEAPNDQGWVAIDCPWADEHTPGGNDDAGYNPLGEGGPEWEDKRGFKCFHDSCRERHARDFIDWAVAQGAPRVPAGEPGYPLLTRFAYHATDRGQYAFDMADSTFKRYSLTSLRGLLANDPVMLNADNKKDPIKAWVDSPSRITVRGVINDPRHPFGLTTDEHGALVLNSHRNPDWRDAQADAKAVAQFMRLLEHVVPGPKDREFVLNWITAKVQTPWLKGPAIIMTTPKHGVGRSMLMKVVMAVLGPANCRRLSLKQLLKPGSFAEWPRCLFVAVDETWVSSGRNKQLEASERLKEICDVTGHMEMMGVKFESDRQIYFCTSFMFASNHSDAMALPENDRRFYVLRNSTTEGPADMYADVVAGLEDPLWVAALGRWLTDRDLAGWRMEQNVREADCPAKREMREVSRNEVDEIGEALIDYAQQEWHGVLPSKTLISQLLKESYTMRYGPNGPVPLQMVGVVAEAIMPKLSGQYTRNESSEAAQARNKGRRRKFRGHVVQGTEGVEFDAMGGVVDTPDAVGDFVDAWLGGGRSFQLGCFDRFWDWYATGEAGGEAVELTVVGGAS